MSNWIPILCMDFDGVIHSYSSGWQGADNIPDDPVPGAFAFLIKASGFFEIAIYSSRSGQEGGIKAMQEWMLKHGLDSLFVCDTLKWPTEKPPAFITIDDRAICFDGTFPDPKELRNFKPWNKKGE
jgi:hypothetical protein